MNRKLKTTTSLIVILLLLALLIGGLTQLGISSRAQLQFSSLEEFSAQWKQTPEAERHELVGWLLGESPARHTDYPVQQTRLAGMSREEVESLLGFQEFPLDDVVAYYLGSIEPQGISGFIVGKQDALWIEFDDQGIVKLVKTVS